MTMPYHLGCPLWSNKKWVGELFTDDAKPADYLLQYASVFNTVEGNTTFYALPKEETVVQWMQKTPEDFKFCFKFPQAISHTLRLRNAEAETKKFFERMAPLESRLGPFFLQLPPSFDGKEFFFLVAFFNNLPDFFHCAVEVRHPNFYGGGAWEAALNDFLSERNIDRVLFDTRGLHAYEAPADDFATREAQRKKPKVAVNIVATGEHPFVRFIGHPAIEKNEKALREWAKIFKEWIDAGKKPFFFTHASDDFFAPKLAGYFHSIMRELIEDLPPMPAWPAEVEARRSKQQLDLF